MRAHGAGTALSTPRSAARAAVAVVVAGITVLAVITLPTTAHADPDLGSARERAKALAEEVERIEVDVALAVEEYDTLQVQLGSVVQQFVDAQEAVDDLRSAEQDARAKQAARVRALYISGGQVGLVATVLDGSSPSDVMARLDTVGRILDAETSIVSSNQALRAAKEADVARLDQLTTQRNALQDRASAAADSVRALLARKETELAQADADVVRLAEVERQRRLAAAHAAAATTLGASGSLTPPPLPTDAPPAVATALAAATSRIGLPYVWGATGPDVFDCSGLTGWSYRQAGVQLPRTSREQWRAGQQVALTDLRPGDLLFWARDVSDPRTIHHVSLYAGDGLMVHAPQTGDVVRVARVGLNGYIGAVRPVAWPAALAAA